MLGSVDTWFYKFLTGIRCESPGWQRILIKPFIPNDMNYAHSSIKTYKGSISCSWEKFGDSLKISTSIPVGVTAEIWLPNLNSYNEIKENGDLIWSQNMTSGSKLKFLKEENNYVVYLLGSGFYTFNLQ
jgi:alpha-L-rhamnosidase